MTSATGGLAAGPLAIEATKAAAAAAIASPTTGGGWDLIWKIPIGVVTWVSVFTVGKEIDESSFSGDLNVQLNDIDF